MIATFLWLIRLNVEPERIATVPHSDQLPVPIPTRCQDSVSADESTTDEDDITIDDYVLNFNLEEKKNLLSQLERSH